MAGNLLENFGTSNQAITCTINGLTSTSARESTAVDNSSNAFQDALVFLILKTNASGTSGTGWCNVYAYATVDGGTNYTDTCTGTNAAVTLTSPPNVRLIGIVNMVANNTTYHGGPFSVASAFGSLPAKWGIVVENKTGADLNASGNSALFQGIFQAYT